jgi:hypothetical protein
MDILSIHEEVCHLDALNLSGKLKEEIEYIKDLMMVMDYDRAAKQITGLLSGK